MRREWRIGSGWHALVVGKIVEEASAAMGVVKTVVVAANRICVGIRECRLGLGRRFETGESRLRLRDE